MWKPALVIALLAAAGGGASFGVRHVQEARGQSVSCIAPGGWADGQGASLTAKAALERAGAARFVLLGERHGEVAHHRWQAATIEALARTRPVVIGLEQLPRTAQPSLDAYLTGGIDEATFLRAVRWDEVWGHDFAAYRPIFELARANKLAMRALNVDRAFVRRVAREGFAAAAAFPDAPLRTLAPPPDAARARLAESFAMHGRAPDPGALQRFIDAQTVWDRAMAEGLLQAAAADPTTLAVGIMGLGHVEYGHGVEHQLIALGVAPEDVFSAIPVSNAQPCILPPGYADAVFGGG